LNNQKAHLLKKVGKIGEFKEEKKLSNSSVAIGHTRWATHGKVSVVNSHPHFSSDKHIFVVHNGIVENYKELKEELIKTVKEKGQHF